VTFVGRKDSLLTRHLDDAVSCTLRIAPEGITANPLPTSCGIENESKNEKCDSYALSGFVWEFTEYYFYIAKWNY
jgi:hypothetical protein